MLHHFHTPVADIPLPERFTFPFCYTPHPLCVAAAKEVQAYLGLQEAWKEELAQGKMFGVSCCAFPLYCGPSLIPLIGIR
jgi:tRNA pseudouridine32 synthase/23S rRNA pseudouridine746 synthase